MRLENQSLEFIFQSIGAVLQERRDELNRCDLVSGKHGDQMVEVFQIATNAVANLDQVSLMESLTAAAEQLENLGESDIAKIYAHGLTEMAAQLKLKQVSLQELTASLQSTLTEEGDRRDVQKNAEKETRTGQVIKCLLAGLAGWNQYEESLQKTGPSLDFGVLVEIGMAYLQAKQRNEARIDVLADTAASASPLGKNDCYRQSGVIVFKALLQSVQQLSI